MVEDYLKVIDHISNNIERVFSNESIDDRVKAVYDCIPSNIKIDYSIIEKIINKSVRIINKRGFNESVIVFQQYFNNLYSVLKREFYDLGRLMKVPRNLDFYFKGVSEDIDFIKTKINVLLGIY